MMKRKAISFLENYSGSFPLLERGIKGEVLKRFQFILIAVLVFFTVTVQAQIPERPSPQRLVNDLAGMLNADEVATLENKLNDYNDSTSTQICIVTVNNLDGDEAGNYAFKLSTMSPEVDSARQGRGTHFAYHHDQCQTHCQHSADGTRANLSQMPEADSYADYDGTVHAHFQDLA